MSIIERIKRAWRAWRRGAQGVVVSDEERRAWRPARDIQDSVNRL